MYSHELAVQVQVRVDDAMKGQAGSSNQEIAAAVRECRDRIEGIGAQQYAMNDVQKFEVYTLEEMHVGLREEIEDEINYCVMSDIRLERLEQRLVTDAVRGDVYQALGKLTIYRAQLRRQLQRAVHARAAIEREFEDVRCQLLMLNIATDQRPQDGGA